MLSIVLPVFGILVVADGKLYGGPEVKDSRVQPAMVYTQLADANKVLACSAIDVDAGVR